MIVTIDNDPDLQGMQEFLNVDVRKRTVAFTCRAILEHYCHHEEVELQIHKSLLAVQYSYMLNPAQLAANVNAKQMFANASGYKRQNYVVLLFTNAEPPKSFWELAVQAVTEGGTHTFIPSEVPATYRHTPSLLKYRLKEATGNKKVRILKSEHTYQIVSPKKRQPKE